jgi:hypothetical protein
LRRERAAADTDASEAEFEYGKYNMDWAAQFGLEYRDWL